MEQENQRKKWLCNALYWKCAVSIWHIWPPLKYFISMRFDWVKWRERTTSNGKTRRRTKRLRKMPMAANGLKRDATIAIFPPQFIAFTHFFAVIHSNFRINLWILNQFWRKKYKKRIFSKYLQRHRNASSFYKTICVTFTHTICLYLQQLNECRGKKVMKRWHWAPRYITYFFFNSFFSSYFLSSFR